MFAMVPTRKPDGVVAYSRYIVNASTGIGMDMLKQIIEERIPIVNNNQAITKKEVIYTTRYECPCCNTSIEALVSVSCQGVYVPDESEKVRGLYRVRIDPNRGGCDITVEKLSSTTIYQGRSNYLPKKDYDADPEVAKALRAKSASLGIA